jgi:murein DD-endopeptidase MepM/ murein hydrolase activator NlpD
MRRLVLVAAVLVALLAPVLAGLAPVAAADQPAAVRYTPPVDAPIVDPFRPPPEPWAPGNRGVEYATAPGTPARAAADGEVVFAGPVAGELHVVVLHADGLRTSYSFLASVAVHRGDRVRRGQPVGTTGSSFHFGARAGDAYLDPTRLFGDGPPEVHLVPDELRRPGTEAEERRGLLRMFEGYAGRVVAVGAGAVDWARGQVGAFVDEHVDELRGAVHYASETNPFTHAGRVLAATGAWLEARDECTPGGVPAPRLAERHVAVLVGGLGSTSAPRSAAVDHVDTAALGYAASDVVRFSYNGGTTAESQYTADDSVMDMRRSARRLRELLNRVAAEHPGVPIDVIAHSQGGVVARTALTDEADPGDPRSPPVSALVTLGSPHQGTELATALTMLGHTWTGKAVEAGAHAALPGQADPQAPSVQQMAEESEFMRELNRRRLPPGLRVTSIAARGDLVVPAGQTRLRGAKEVTVSVDSIVNDHGELPGSAQAQREIALGLAGMDPTCQAFADMLTDVVVSETIGMVENEVGARAWAAGRQADSRIGPAAAAVAGKVGK